MLHQSAPHIQNSEKCPLIINPDHDHLATKNNNKPIQPTGAKMVEATVSTAVTRHMVCRLLYWSRLTGGSITPFTCCGPSICPSV